MFQDEFNKVEITNEKQLKRVEFGKTQAAEFTSKKENAIPEGDLNEKYVGKTIKKVTEINVDYVNKVPTHASQTVVTNSTTATSAGAAAASTAVAASTVAVVAIATVTGISAALHDYQVDFQTFLISSNELKYELTVIDKNQSDEYLSYEESGMPYNEPISEDIEEDDPLKSAPFLLRVFDDEYDEYQPVWYYQNSGIFDRLQLGHTYNITLTENRYGGETLFQDAFTTFTNTKFDSFSISGSCDIEDNYFEVEMQFVDETESFSDFALVLFDPENPERTSFTYPLEKQAGLQFVTTTDSDQTPLIDYTKEWGYRFSYKDNGEIVNYDEGTVSFFDWLGRESIFRELVFDKTANFIENSITVTLDYKDDFGWYEDFMLNITMIPSNSQNPDGTGSDGQDDYFTQEIPLTAINQAQKIVLDEYEIYVRDDYFKYTYSLTCNYRGVETVLAEETTPFTFTDNSGGISEFYRFVFTKEANFLDNTFKVTLDYKDDFGSYDSFKLSLFPNGVNAQYDFNLENTTEEQTLTFDPQLHYNFSFDYEYTYYLTCYYNFEEKELDSSDEFFTFTDISGGVSEYRGITFTGLYEMSTGQAPVQLDYQDDFNYLSNFVLHVSNPIVEQPGGGPNPFRANSGEPLSENDYPYEIPLEKTLEVQYIELYESGIPTSAEAEFTYAVTYQYRGEEQAPVIYESKIVFDDPDATSEVTGITFVNGEANFNERSFVVELNFQDDFGYFSDFSLQIWDDTNGGWVEKELDYTTDPQTVVIDEFDEEQYVYPVDIVSGSLTYNLVYVSSETGDPAAQYFFDTPQPVSFTNSLKSEFYGLDTTFDFTELSSDTYSEYRLPFRFDMVNDAEYFSVPELYITSLNNEEEVLATISFQNETMHSNWQYGSFSPNGSFTIEELTNGDEYNVVVACYEKESYDGAEQRNIKFSEPHSFTLNQKQEICGIEMANYIVYGEWKGYATLVGNGDFTTLENGQIIFESTDDGTVLTYNLTLTEFLEFDLLSPRERTTTEQFINDYFSYPVNITFAYKDPTSGETITMDCYTNYLFQISNQLTN